MDSARADTASKGCTNAAVSALRTASLPTLAAATAVAYYVGVQLGLALTFSSDPVSTLWPPNAILLTALLSASPRKWWVILLCVFPAHLAAELGAGVPLSMSALWFISNCTEATLGAILIRHFVPGWPQLNRVHDVSVLVAAAGVAAPILSSFLDTGFVSLTGWRYTTYWHVWESRTLSNSLAALIFMPLAATLLGPRTLTRSRMTLAAQGESLLLLLGLCLASVMAFQQPRASSLVLMYAPLPFLLWAALRRGTGFVALCSAILALFAITGLQHGRGPFTDTNPETAAHALETSLLIAATSFMLLAAALAELRDAKGLALARLEHLNLALAAARMGTWQWNFEQDRISWTGAEIRGTAKVGPGALSSRALLRHVEPQDRSRLWRAFEKSSAATCEAEFRMRADDGSQRWISSRGKTIHAEPGDPPSGMMGVYADVTRRKSQEAQLTTQREQIARLNRASLPGVLSGTLAHDLLQPLTAILSNAEAARAGLQRVPPSIREVDEALSDIIADNIRMIDVVRQIRTLFERGEVTDSVLDVNECVETATLVERNYLLARSATLELRLGTGLRRVRMNAVQLQQILINLLINACEAMELTPRQERHIDIATSPREDGAVEIVVGDNGAGIDSPELIFEPFFTTKPQGLGLGLAICRMIVTAHGGRLWAANKPTRGAALHVLLPAAGISINGMGGEIQEAVIRNFSSAARAESERAP